MAHDPERDLDKQRALLKRVSQLVREGKIRASRKEFQAGMQAYLPEHPLRFSLILKRVDVDNLRSYIEHGREIGASPNLRLEGDEVHSNQGFIGKIAAKDMPIIDQLQSLIELYMVRPLELKWDETSDPVKLEYFAVEIVRPELYFDTGGNLYSPSDPSGPNETSEDGAEVPPVILQRELEKILRQERGESENYPRGHDGVFRGFGDSKE